MVKNRSREILLPLRKCFLIITGMLCLILAVPLVSGFADTSKLGNQVIVFNITSPEQDDMIFLDVAPGYFSVEGQIFGTNLQNVTVVYQNETKECGKSSGTHIDVSCEFQAGNEQSTIIMTVSDINGTTVSETRNFTLIGGLFGPETVFVSGYVTDSGGVPIKDASLTFETASYGKFFSLNTTTDMNGRYSMKKTEGHDQKITVTKTGYQPVVRNVHLESLGGTQNFILYPVDRYPVSLNFFTLFIAVCIGIGVLALRQRNP